ANLRLRLLRSTRLLEEAQRVAHIGSWEWQAESGLWGLSDEMYRLLGLEPRDPQLTLDYFLGLIKEQYRDEVARALELAMAENVPYDLDYPISLGDGERRIIRAQGAQVLDACGVRWLVGTAQDVTDLRKADALKDDFVATASHELRTPTTVIAGFAGILHSQWDQLDDDARREIVGRINGASIRLTRLISDVLYISQIESHHICLSPVEFSMSGLLHETVADLDSDRVQLSIAVGADKLLAFADPSRQRQVLDNLLSNALRYSPDDEPIVIELSGVADATMLQVRVVDYGPGIPAEARERIFERFERINTPDGNAAAGTGLGLYISRELVRLCGGDIRIEDGPTGGAAFVFTTPRSPRTMLDGNMNAGSSIDAERLT
ncbi:MAG: hypothetical protein H7123_08150, partial [Thermoleophilia bacterium]|nr:hypothetical protein [Thermoleophilia bacterium]